MLKIEITPGYEHLQDFLTQLPVCFEQGDGRTIHVGRNVIKVMEADGILLNVKRYHVPSFFNRIVYSFFRVPKGKRAFTYPNILLQKGFETPRPVAYVEERAGGLIGYSYFVSLQCPYRRKFYEFGNASIADCREVVSAFARLTARLHEAEIYHRDYSPGNILFDYVDGQYHFRWWTSIGWSLALSVSRRGAPILPGFGDKRISSCNWPRTMLRQEG